MSSKVAALGSIDFVTMYSALGADPFVIGADKAESLKVFESIDKDQYALMLVEESVALRLQTAIESIRKRALPCVVVLAFTTEPGRYSMDELRKVLKAATGIDILSTI